MLLQLQVVILIWWFSLLEVTALNCYICKHGSAIKGKDKCNCATTTPEKNCEGFEDGLELRDLTIPSPVETVACAQIMAKCHRIETCAFRFPMNSTMALIAKTSMKLQDSDSCNMTSVNYNWHNVHFEKACLCTKDWCNNGDTAFPGSGSGSGSGSESGSGNRLESSIQKLVILAITLVTVHKSLNSEYNAI